MDSPIHYHIGHNLAGCPESDVECYTDPDEALSAYTAMVREYAETDDEATWTALDHDESVGAETHRQTAADWHSGQGSALYSYASTGFLAMDLLDEIRQVKVEVKVHPGLYVRADWQAVDALLRHVERLIADDQPAMLATVDSILTDDPPVAGEPYGMIVEDGQGRPISLWLATVPASDCCDGGD